MDKKLLKKRMGEYLATIGAELSVFKGHQPARYQQFVSNFNHGTISGMMLPLGWSKSSVKSECDGVTGVILNMEHVSGQVFALIQLLPGVVKKQRLERVPNGTWNVISEEVRHA